MSSLAFLQIVGFTGADVSLVYLTTAPVSPIGIQFFASFSLSVIFVTALFVFALREKSWKVLWLYPDANVSPLQWGSLYQIAALAALLNVLNGVLTTYASPPSRTPPLIQAILTNSAPLFAVPFSKLLLKDRKRYCTPWPLAAAGTVALGVFVSLLPTLLQGRPDEDAELEWVAVFAVSMIPAAAYSVVQVCEHRSERRKPLDHILHRCAATLFD